ncbi:chitin synthase 2 [[Candida] jaroonii]|uniref:Chitin synthase 2 n=1 Tax=[Candida] jaroonii TaxID=467808 RepID=A0ACA9YDT4_9ASCO|nr:chitin synthase 2 [[Candida] jaroonii]
MGSPSNSKSPPGKGSSRRLESNPFELDDTLTDDEFENSIGERIYGTNGSSNRNNMSDMNNMNMNSMSGIKRSSKINDMNTFNQGMDQMNGNFDYTDDFNKSISSFGGMGMNQNYKFNDVEMQRMSMQSMSPMNPMNPMNMMNMNMHHMNSLNNLNGMNMGNMMTNGMSDPFMPPQPPQIYHSKQPSNYTASTLVQQQHPKVSFKEGIEYPDSAYKGYEMNNDEDYYYDEEDEDGESNEFGVHRSGTYRGNDYNLNMLEDVNDSLQEDDPFDDESLFSELEEKNDDQERLRRANTVYSESSFKPKLNYTKTIKRAKLVNGNYVIDCPTPEGLIGTFGKKIEDGQEMKFLRYQAVTCGPSNFINRQYDLRQAMYTPRRDTEIMIVITMYNEDEILLAKTLKGVFENISNLSRRKDPCWGEDSWKKIVVTIVSDGRAAVNPRSEKLLKALGVFQDNVAKSKVNEENVKGHIFEYTSPVGIETINDKIHLETNEYPTQFIYCLKEKNTRKINSHRWCLQSFAPILNPKVVMLLDCGTVPAKSAVYHLWRSFHDENVAGACGEMKTSLGPGKKLLINPLVAAQNFEYKISNVLDKPMESVFGFISVLPGAFSAYRYEALLNVNGQGPLEKYFKGEYLHDRNDDPDDDEHDLRDKNFREVGIFTRNMYLAEDRILCFELVAKKGYNYILRYVSEAKAETDVPETIEDFVLQRRRWLNGSLFAAIYSIVHWTNIWKSNHSLLRKLFLQLEFYYQLVVIVVSWFSLGSFFLVFEILTSNLGSKEVNLEVAKYISIATLWLYVASIIATFVLAFGNTPRGTKKFYMIIAVIFSILMVYMLFSAIYLAVNTVQTNLAKVDFTAIMLVTNSKFRDLVISTGSTYVLYFVASLMYGEPSFMMTSFIQYLLLSPTYVNVLNIYSFCNIDDISWGTRQEPVAKNLGTAKAKNDVVMVEEIKNNDYLDTLEDLRVVPDIIIPVAKMGRDDNYYALIRTVTVLVWLFSNLILICIVLEIGGVDKVLRNSEYNYISPNSEVFLGIILWIVAGLAIYRFIGSVLFLIFKLARPLKWKFRNRNKK